MSKLPWWFWVPVTAAIVFIILALMGVLLPSK
jgi:hypothetical protein